jgi:hypothetical protein
MRQVRKHRQALVLAGSVAVVLSVLLLISPMLPAGIDWRDTYRPAALALLQGKDPYAAEVAPYAPFFAAPWGLLPLIPLAVLPLHIGRALLLFVSLAALAYSARKLGARPIALAAFLVAPPVVHCLLNANIEWIPLLGFVLPPQLGLFFIAVKPQTGFAVAVFWFIEAWRAGGWRKALETFAPVTAALLLSFLLFGLWPFKFGGVLAIAESFNASLWPWSIPVGLALVAAAVYKRKAEFAMPASPCLSPYVLFHSWSSALIAVSAYDVIMVAVSMGLWLLVIIRLL